MSNIAADSASGNVAVGDYPEDSKEMAQVRLIELLLNISKLHYGAIIRCWVCYWWYDAVSRSKQSVQRRVEVEVEEMRGARVMISTRALRSTFTDIHSLHEFLRPKT